MSRLLPLLMAETGLNEHDLRSVIRTAPVRYKRFLIPKRSGGMRIVSQPAREVKLLQRVLLTRFLSSFDLHPAATAYRLGKSIRFNALAHAGSGPILKFDFKDFFPSLTDTDWHFFCVTNSVFSDDEDIVISSRIMFCGAKSDSKLALAIGAPTSPYLSNLLLREFDSKVTAMCAKDKVIYTRYADDLTFSADRTGFLVNIEKNLRGIMHSTTSPRLRLNEKKRVFATRKYKRMVTGLVIANDGNVSVGRERKRRLRAALHHFQNGQLSHQDAAKLSGMLAFVEGCDPEFYQKIVASHGIVVISALKRHKTSFAGELTFLDESQKSSIDGLLGRTGQSRD